MIGVGKGLGQRRLVSRAVELGVVVLLFSIPRVGPLLGLIAALGMDAIPGGSPGKRLMGLIVKRSDGTVPIGLGASFIRNLPVVLVLFFAAIGGVIGWIAAVALAITSAAFETSLVFSDSRGQRAFDILAATIVVDARVPDAGPQRPVESDEEATKPKKKEPSSTKGARK